ncbi:MAG: Ribonuclease R winged-helix domain protein [Syntrophorhabdus sp. PtaU1.Bin050]|nr:MAG: Ribonuclease R winged-helix domain protein [Syntrophorhabdus sp. PtaU1.Bin050]
MNRTMFAILSVLDKSEGTVGSTELSRQLLSHGIELSERTVRHYLKLLDQKGLTQVQAKRGRTITDSGKTELGKAFVSERVNFIINKIDSFAYLTDFNIDTLKGNVVLNISFFPEKKIRDVIKIMAPVFESPYVVSNRIVLSRGEDRIGDVAIPRGCVGLGTVCSITLNGIFLKTGIPVTSRYGGVIEVEDGEPARFTSLISYEGSSMDPLEIFIRSRMTDITGIMKDNAGKALASLREIPVVSINEAERLSAKMIRKGLGGRILFGKPNQPFLDIPVGVDKVGMLAVGGLNPIAAVQEAGIETENRAMSTLYEYSKLLSFNDAVSTFLYT